MSTETALIIAAAAAVAVLLALTAVLQHHPTRRGRHHLAGRPARVRGVRLTSRRRK